MSLNLRIITSATIVLAFFISLTAITLDRAFHQSTESALQDSLVNKLYAIMAATEVDEQENLILPSQSLDALLGLPSSGLYAQIIDQRNKTLWRSSSTLGIHLPAPESLASGEKEFTHQTINNGDYIMFSYGVNWATETGALPLTFSITTDLKSFNKQIRSYRRNLLGWLLAMAILLIVSQAIILRWGLSPLRKVGQEINQIELGKQEQIEGNYPQEIKRLTNNINLLIQQERSQKARYRNALGDLAHSLKTPLAVLNNAVAEKDNASDATLKEQISRMNTIIEYQLQRAATAGSSQLGQSTPVQPAIEKIIASLQKVYQDKNIEVSVNVTPDLIFKGDEGDLLEILGNLLDNAFKWADHKIYLHALSSDKKLKLIIEDDGPGIKKDQIDRLLQRGARMDQNVPGQGLGLSIVNNIVEAYRGEIKIEAANSHNRNRGARIIVLI